MEKAKVASGQVGGSGWRRRTGSAQEVTKNRLAGFRRKVHNAPAGGRLNTPTWPRKHLGDDGSASSSRAVSVIPHLLSPPPALRGGWVCIPSMSNPPRRPNLPDPAGIYLVARHITGKDSRRKGHITGKGTSYGATTPTGSFPSPPYREGEEVGGRRGSRPAVVLASLSLSPPPAAEHTGIPAPASWSKPCVARAARYVGTPVVWRMLILSLLFTFGSVPLLK